ncbi:MAG TPA: hypothetical protein VF407_17270, partial [Polyangiaceae bacterium]
REAIATMKPEYAIGVGQYATDKLEAVLPAKIKLGTILHPSPASPAANRDWPGAAKKSLTALGLGDLM